MKKLMLTIAGLLFVSVMAVNAQVTQDTTSTTTMGTDQSTNYTKDMEVVQPTDVPSSLRSTLKGSEYSGWEQGKVYRNTTTNEYLIVIGDDNAKVYRFDSNGSRIEDLDKSGSNSSGSGSSTSGSSTSGSSTSGSSSSDMNSGSNSSGSTSGTTGSGTTGTTGSGSTSGSSTNPK